MINVDDNIMYVGYFQTQCVNVIICIYSFSADAHGGLLPYSGCANRCRRGLSVFFLMNIISFLDDISL